MGILDGLFGSTDNTSAGFGVAINDLNQTRDVTDPFYTQNINNATLANQETMALLGLGGGSESALERLRSTPGYDFAMQRGQEAIDQSAIARGGLNSGATLKSLTQFGQGLADQQFQTRLSNLSGLNQGGFAGASGLTNNSNQYGQLQIGQGQAIDQGNVASAGNALGMLGTATGFLGGGGGSNALSSLGRLF